MIALLTLGFLALIAAGVAVALLTMRNQVHTEWVNHTYEVEIAIDRASILQEGAETARRGYLATRQPAYLEAYRTAVVALSPAIARIARLSSDNPVQRANVARYRALTDAIGRQRAITIALLGEGRGREAIAAFGRETNAERMRGLRDAAAAMAGQERALLAIRDREQQRSVRVVYAVLIATGLLILILGALAAAIVARYTRELGKSRDILRGFAETLEDQVAARTADLSRANEEIQRFAYIVSHDLRSPLVNVMGFTAELEAATAPLAELVDRAEAEAPQIVTEDARLAAREDLPESIGFIRTSTQKMDRLINAILKLSREGRRVIAPEPLESAAIVTVIEGSMSHILDERGVTLTIERPLPGLVSDRLAVEQILSNLIENASKYLQPGRPGEIRVSGREQRGRVILSVADNGRGIDLRDHQRVFDLFRRSGQQDQPGEGIGLAHVRALAYRLGGTIDLQSVLGEGATFSLNLPKTFEPPKPIEAQDSKA